MVEQGQEQIVETQQTTQVVEQSATAPQFSEAQDMISSLGQFLSPDKIAELEKVATEEKAFNEKKAPKAEEKKVEPTNTENVEEGAEKKEEKTEVKPDDKKTDEVQKKDILGLNKTKPKQNELTIEKPEDVLGVIKSKYGQDLKDIKELPKFFESVDKMRLNSQKFEETNTKLSALEKELTELPSEFHEAFDLFAKGLDYSKAFTGKSAIKLDVPFEKQDKKALVNTYFPGKFTDEDFAEDADNKSEILKMAEEAAETKFKAEKQNYDSQRAAMAAKAENQVKLEKQAASSSVNNLKQRFPDIDTETFNSVKDVVEGGAQKIMSLFFNKDGTVKPETALKLLMAEYHEDIMESRLGQQEHAIETKVNEEILSRGADRPNPTRTNGGAPEKIDPEIQKQIDEMKQVGSMSNQRTF